MADFRQHFSGETNWNPQVGSLTITSSGYLNFIGKDNPHRRGNTGDGAAYFIWNVPPEVKRIVIDSCVTVNAAFHTSEDIVIAGKDRATSIIYGTSIQDWEDYNGTGVIGDVYNYSAIQSFGGKLTVRNLSIVDPKAFCIRAFRQRAEIIGVNFIDTRGGEQNHSDGVSAGKGSIIEDCYFETGDDNVKVYAANMVVRNCTFNMVKNAVPIQLGWGKYSDGASATLTNIKVTGDSGRTSAGNAVIGSGKNGEGTVRLNIDGLRVDNPTASLVNFRSPGQRLRGKVKNASIRVKNYWGPMPAGGRPENSKLSVCGERVPAPANVKFWHKECRQPGAAPVVGSSISHYTPPVCMEKVGEGRVGEIAAVRQPLPTNQSTTAPAAAPTSSRSLRTDLGQSEKPNIVFIFSDDLSFRDLSAYGQRNYRTPNLDALAGRATRFTQAYTAAPECAPSRGALMTGKHVGHGPIRINSSARGFEPLPADTYTFGHFLQQAGYRTGVIGKWGIGYRGSTGEPLKQGFDYHFGYLSHYEAHSYFPLELFENERTLSLPGNEAFPLEDLYAKKGTENNPAFAKMYDSAGKLRYLSEPDATYAPDLMDEKAAAFIQRNREQPFLLYFTTNLPHGPSIADDLRSFRNRDDMDINSREWGAMVERLDVSVGRLVEQLKAAGVYDNTVIIFASDNGYAMHNPKQNADGETYWPDDPWLKNKGPFQGGKFSVREAGMRVPFFVCLPNQEQPRIVSTPVWLVDLFPTFVELAGRKSTPVELDGTSLVPLLKDTEGQMFPNSRPFYFYKNNEQSVRWGPWFAWRPHPNEPVALYLPEEDQFCAADLAEVYPEVQSRMTRYLDTIHEDHPWYWNPGDTREIFNEKRRRAERTGQLITRYRPNNMLLMPWERK